MTTESNKTEDLPIYQLVHDFMEAFETSDSINLWASLVKEELYELIEAMALDIADATQKSLENVLKEACDLMYVLAGFALVADPYGVDISEETAHQVNSVLKPIKNIFGRERISEAFRRVHASNMSKLGNDGRPVRREDGKILKGPNYQPPDLSDVVFPVYLLTNTAPITPAKN